MNLTDLLLYTKNKENTEYLNLFEETSKEKVDGELLSFKQTQQALIIPTIADTHHIIDMVRSFVGKKGLFEVERLINCVFWNNSLDSLNVEYVKYIQNLILFTVNHKRFKHKLARSSDAVKTTAEHNFYKLVPLLSFSVVNRIINDKDFVHVYEKLVQLVEKCYDNVKNQNLGLRESPHGVEISVLTEDIMTVSFRTTNRRPYVGLSNSGLASYEEVMKLKIDSDHLERYIDAVNACIDTDMGYGDPIF